MKYAVADFGMSVWEGGCFDIELRLKDLQSIGYNGIERLECVDAEDAIHKAAIFHRMGMDFATCRCNVQGSCGQQCSNRFTAAFGKEYTWLIPGDTSKNVSMETFVRRSNTFIRACNNYGIKAALHNHLGCRVETQEELDIFMKEVPEAMLLLDIGHLHGAGGDLLGTIEKYFDRIAAVHFKDVFIKDESIGLDRWTERLRFCELGAGNSNEQWTEAAKLLKKLGYNKWVMVEHDTHLREPLVDLKVSIDKLKEIFEA